MLISKSNQERVCEECGKPVKVSILFRLPMQRGLGGMERPKRGGFYQVECENCQQCKKLGRDCVWAVGMMQSKRDPLGLRLPIE